MIADLPEPARRYFLHAIRLGTPLASRVHLMQEGSIRLGSGWAPFTAEQALAAGRGFVWKVRARIGGLPFTGTDHYAQGQGRTRIAAFGLVPIVNETGPNLSRSTSVDSWWSTCGYPRPCCLRVHDRPRALERVCRPGSAAVPEGCSCVIGGRSVDRLLPSVASPELL